MAKPGPSFLSLLPHTARSWYTHPHLLSTCPKSGITWFLLLTLTAVLWGGWICTFYRCRNWGSEGSCHVPKITQRWIMKLGAKYRVVWLQSWVHMKCGATLPSWTLSEGIPHPNIGSHFVGTGRWGGRGSGRGPHQLSLACGPWVKSELRSYLCLFTVGWLWATLITSLSLSSLPCKIGSRVTCLMGFFWRLHRYLT